MDYPLRCFTYQYGNCLPRRSPSCYYLFFFCCQLRQSQCWIQDINCPRYTSLCFWHIPFIHEFKIMGHKLDVQLLHHSLPKQLPHPVLLPAVATHLSSLVIHGRSFLLLQIIIPILAMRYILYSKWQISAWSDILYLFLTNTLLHQSNRLLIIKKDAKFITKYLSKDNLR